MSVIQSYQLQNWVPKPGRVVGRILRWLADCRATWKQQLKQNTSAIDSWRADQQVARQFAHFRRLGQCSVRISVHGAYGEFQNSYD